MSRSIVEAYRSTTEICASLFEIGRFGKEVLVGG